MLVWLYGSYFSAAQTGLSRRSIKGKVDEFSGLIAGGTSTTMLATLEERTPVAGHSGICITLSVFE